MTAHKRPSSVPWGQCHFYSPSSISDNDQWSNPRIESSTKIISFRGAMQNVLFVETATHMSLCRLSTPIPVIKSQQETSSKGKSHTMCNYESSVQVRIQSANYDIKTLFHSMMLNNTIRPLGTIRERKTKEEDSATEEQQSTRIRHTSKYEDISIELLHDGIYSLDKQQQSDIRDDNTFSSTIGCVALISQKPVPLLSMSIFRVNTKKSLRRSTKDESPSNVNSALLQACHKRQLVGRALMFDDGNGITTDFALGSSNSSSDRANCFQYRIASVLPQPGMPKEDSNVLYLVLPSTRITIMDDVLNDESLKEECNNRLDETERKPAILSFASRLLMETIHCIRTKLKHGNVNVSRSFLLTGPPGVGKTFAVKTALEESERELPDHTLLISIAGSELLSQGNQLPAEASKALQTHFIKAVNFCRASQDHVALIFLDECEALVSVDSVASMLANLLDKVSAESSNRSGWKQIIVVAATNRIDAVPAWLRRPGRMDREVVMSPPNAKERASILKSLLHSLHSKQEQGNLMNDVNIPKQGELMEVAEVSVGYVAADLAALVRRAAMKGIQQGASQVTAKLLKEAMAEVGASALRDAALSAPPTTRWEDIAGDAGGAKTALRRAVEWPRTKRKAFESLGLVPPRGILLHGPPGCAKTTLARAAAGACGIAFFSLSPADVYASSYVGEAESVIRRSFTLARSAAPCILFFDEIDAVLGSNTNNDGGMGGRGSSAEARVLSTFLNEMDGVDGSREDGVLVLGATNRPSTLDAALLRPGRFDKVIYVPPPDEIGRKSILAMQCKKWKCPTTNQDKSVNGNTGTDDSYINIDLLAGDDMTGSMTGAEIVGACREASMLVLRKAMEDNNGNSKMTHEFLAKALKNVKPLLSDPHVLEEYTSFEKNRSSS